MKTPKDNFSQQSADYSRYRPVYPQSLYDFIYHYCPSFDCALDCATGNGQAARVLSQKFKEVYATDISQSQIGQAHQETNIYYSVQRAEQTDFTDASFDLITVGQAYHWFDFLAFGTEANRLLKPGGIAVIWTYGLLRLNKVLTPLLDNFYKEVTFPYWDEERRWVDLGYKQMPFHFNEIKTDFNFQIQKEFTLEELEGYLNTWSGVKHFINQEGYNPVSSFIKEIKPFWKSVTQKVTYPGFVRIGRKH